MQKADRSYRAMKGISEYSDSIMELRIADASMVKNWKEGESPLFAFEPSGDDSNWQFIEAYDVYGQVHQLMFMRCQMCLYWLSIVMAQKNYVLV